MFSYASVVVVGCERSPVSWIAGVLKMGIGACVYFCVDDRSDDPLPSGLICFSWVIINGSRRSCAEGDQNKRALCTRHVFDDLECIYNKHDNSIKHPKGRAMVKYDGLEGGPSHKVITVTEGP